MNSPDAKKSRRRTSPRRGYVLVATLGLLVLASTLLVAVGRAAVDHALLASREEQELQQRWATISCRAAILPFAETVLAQREQDLHRPLPLYRTTVYLCGRPIEIVLCDEQAKSNVNTLIYASDKSRAENRIRQALAGSGLANAIRLRPQAGPKRSSNIDGFGQIFDNVPPNRLLNGVGSSPVQILTCWGNGTVNVMRASQDVLELTSAGIINRGEIGRLLQLRDDAFAPLDIARSSLMRPSQSTPIPSPNADAVSSLLTRARIDPKVRNKLALTSRSTCHSLWIITGSAGQKHYSLYVSDESEANNRQIQAFVW